MLKRFVRIYKNLDINELKEHLLICGDLSASCAKCREMGLKLEVSQCPKCGTEFKYITFINVRDNMAKMVKFSETRLSLLLVDYEDFKKLEGANKAKELFG